MIHSLIRHAVRFVAGAAFVTVATVANGGSIQITPTININVTGGSCSWDGQSINCVASSDGSTPPTGPGSPTGCTASGTTNPSPLTSSGGQVTLTSGCAGTNTYSWTQNGNAFSTSQNPAAFAVPANTSSNPQTYTYVMTACTSGSVTACTQASPPVTITVPGVGGTDPCASFASVHILDISWSNPQNVLTTSSGGGVGPNDVIIVRFTTGSGTNFNQYGHITGAEWTSDTSTRVAALSTQMCNFGSALGPGAALTSSTATVNFSVGGNNSGYYPALQPNTTYYFNVKQAPASGCTASGNCNMFFTLQKPPGL